MAPLAAAVGIACSVITAAIVGAVIAIPVAIAIVPISVITVVSVSIPIVTVAIAVTVIACAAAIIAAAANNHFRRLYIGHHIMITVIVLGNDLFID